MMPDEFIDLTVTSPPYDNLRQYKGYSFPFEDIAKELYRVTKTGGIVVWVVSDATDNGSETGSSLKQALYFMQCGFNLHDTMIYAKQFYVPLTHNRYEQEFEYMFVLSKGKPKTFNPLKTKTLFAGKKSTITHRKTGEEPVRGTNYGEARKEERIIGNVWWFQPNRDSKHPAVFPEKLAFAHIQSWSNEGELVYDCFMGSGSTAKAALSAKRNFIGSEISAEYCKLIDEKLEPLRNNLFTVL